MAVHIVQLRLSPNGPSIIKGDALAHATLCVCVCVLVYIFFNVLLGILLTKLFSF